MTIVPDGRGGYSLDGGIPREAIEELAQFGVIERLSITQTPVLTIKLAQRLERLSVEHLWLWCLVTPRAMQHVIRMPSLRVLDVMRIGEAGRLAGFESARQLEVLRANYRMPESHLLAVTRCTGLRELGAQGAELTRASLSSILALPALETLDLEATAFDNAMARRLSRSETIQSLDLGATRIGREGLEHLVRMPQLRALDLWATDIDVEDLELLRRLPQLESIALGGCDEDALLDPAAVTALLLDLPALKRAWLHGVDVDSAQCAALEARLESLRVTEL